MSPQWLRLEGRRRRLGVFGLTLGGKSSLCLMYCHNGMLWKPDYPRPVTSLTWKSLVVRTTRLWLGALRLLAAVSLMRRHPCMKESTITLSLSMAEELVSARPKWSSKASRLTAKVWLYPPIRY